MDEQQIVALYWQRDDAAIRETQRQYGGYLYRIAFHILADREDSREVLNDTYLRAWDSMPPQRPSALAVYLGRITRQLSIDHWRGSHRQKRRGSAYAQSLEELEDCVCGRETPEELLRARELAEAIGRFLQAQTPQTRQIFLSRYYFADPLSRIAACSGRSVSAVKSQLFRTRQGLKAYLEQEGFDV